MNLRAWRPEILVVVGTAAFAALGFIVYLYFEDQSSVYPTIEEAVIAHELSDPESWLGANAGMCHPCYVTVDDRDPTPEVMQRLSKSYLEFLPGSSWRKERGGLQIGIGAPELQPDGTTTVHHGYACGMVCGGAGTALVSPRRNGWRVLSSRINWVT